MKLHDKVRYGDLILIKFKTEEAFYTVRCSMIENSQNIEITAEATKASNFITMHSHQKSVRQTKPKNLEDTLFLILPPIQSSLLSLKKSIEDKMQLINTPIQDTVETSNHTNHSNLFHSNTNNHNHNANNSMTTSSLDLSEEITSLVIEYNKLKTELSEPIDDLNAINQTSNPNNLNMNALNTNFNNENQFIFRMFR